jgi:hypothetical protein
LLFFDSVVQAGIVALSLFNPALQQPAQDGPRSRFEASVARVLAVEGAMSSIGPIRAERRSTASPDSVSPNIAADP